MCNILDVRHFHIGQSFADDSKARKIQIFPSDDFSYDLKPKSLFMDDYVSSEEQVHLLEVVISSSGTTQYNLSKIVELYWTDKFISSIRKYIYRYIRLVKVAIIWYRLSQSSSKKPNGTSCWWNEVPLWEGSNGFEKNILSFFNWWLIFEWCQIDSQLIIGTWYGKYMLI